MINKTTKVILIGKAKEEFENLNNLVGEQLSKNIRSSEEITLLNSIKTKISFLKENPFYGKNIKKEHNVPNLWRVELSNFWRMLYTIKGGSNRNYLFYFGNS